MRKPCNIAKTVDQYWLCVFSVFAVLGMYAVACWFGALNQDEGWYLYSGRLVSEGMHPFIDYASTQGPIMAYVYALAQPLVGMMGVLGGRIFTAGLGIATLLCAALLAKKCSNSRQRSGAALLVFSLLGLNIYHVYFTSIVKTYSLAGLFVVLGFLALERALRSHQNSDNPTVGEFAWHGFYAFLSAGLFALSAGVRLSAGILLPVVWLMLLGYFLRGNRQKFNLWVLFGFLLGGTVVLLSIFVPFYLKAPEAVKFGLLEYHSARSVGSLPVLIAYKAGFVIRLIGAYFPLAVMGVAALWLYFNRTNSNEDRTDGNKLIPIMLFSVLAVTCVHLLAEFPYDDYQVFIMPLLAVVIAVCVNPVLSKVRFGMFLVIALLIAYSASSRMLQDWMLAKRDRIWWPLRSETPLQRLAFAADKIVDYAGLSSNAKNDVLLTQDTYLAVESGMHVPKGMELGPFCYFPKMDRKKAEACHVLNWEMLREVLVEGKATIAAFSGYGLSISCPQVSQLSIDEQAELWRILEVNYKPVESIDSFGQADTTLRILKWSKKK